MAVDRPDEPTAASTDLAVTEGGNSPIIIPDAAAIGGWSPSSPKHSSSSAALPASAAAALATLMSTFSAGWSDRFC